MITRTLLTALDPSHLKRTLEISPGNAKVAYGIQCGNKQRVVIQDNRANKQYAPEYDGNAIDTTTFSNDSDRLAYAARKGNKWLPVLDGTEGKSYDACLAATSSFSPDGRRFAFGAREGDQRFVVLDGIPQMTFDNISRDQILFSPDGQRYAYQGQKAGTWRIICDGVTL